MKMLWLIFLVAFGWDKFTRISEINEKNKGAYEAFVSGKYAIAVKNYEFLVYEMQESDPKILLNLAHAYLKNNQAEKAKNAYLKCSKSPDAGIRSVAWEQLGTLSVKIQDYKQALTYYKRALIANPKNEQARYNYELLKKYLKENPEKQNQIPPPQQEEKKQEDQKKQEQNKEKQENQNQQQPDQNGQEGEQDKKEPGDQQKENQKEKKPEQNNKQPDQPENQEGNKKDKAQPQGTEKGNKEGLNPDEETQEDKPEPPKPGNKGGNQEIAGKEKNMQTQYERLRQMNISPEKAEMMLDAMKNAEQQYLQQLPKKATKKADRSKPDW